MLSPEQVQFYRDHGYVKVSGVMTPEEISELRRITDDFIEQSRDAKPGDKVFDVEDSHTPENPRLRRLHHPEERHPAYAAIFKHPGILKVLCQLLGPNVRHKGLKLNLKPPRGGEPIEWHQDWAFYPHTNDDVLVLAIMLDDVTAENGPLMVVPDSHKGPVVNHHQNGVFVGAVADEAEADILKSAVTLMGKAGDITVHHTRTLHASESNMSDRYRRLLFITAMAADAWPLTNTPTDMAAYDSHMLVGKPTIAPRLEAVPVRLPIPRASKSESIFEKQREVKFTPFERAADRRSKALEGMNA